MNQHALDYIFTTEGHLIKIDPSLRVKLWEKEFNNGDVSCEEKIRKAVARKNESFIGHSVRCGHMHTHTLICMHVHVHLYTYTYAHTNTQCSMYHNTRRYQLPLSREQLGKIESLVGLYSNKEGT